MQLVNFICCKCDFSGSDMSTLGAHYYIDENKRVIIDRVIAICYGCNSIELAEILPNSNR
jgi:hypothetical protein